MSGLSLFNSQFWHQDQPDILEFTEELDRFGAVVATGDFNGDDYLDVAIGVPGETNLASTSVGVVQVIYGSRDRLTAEDNQVWRQTDFVDELISDGAFGAALATGDFNGDNLDDLAIGFPNAEINDHSQAGAVAVLYGNTDGLVIEDSQFWHQDVQNIKGDAEANDHFGTALAAGDFDGDGTDDLAIGVPDDEINGHDEAGGVAVIYGSRAEGLRTEQDQFWHQDIEDPREDVAGDAEAGDHFGAALAAGDFNGDGVQDLAVGVPDDEINGEARAGGVAIIYGQDTQGLVPMRNVFVHQDTNEILGIAETGDNFGTALAAGQFDNDPYVDLAIGVPGQTINGSVAAGAVQILYGTDEGIDTPRNTIWHQDRVEIDQVAEPNDRFGQSLTAGDLQGINDLDDLVIGAPGEDLGILPDVGVVHLLESNADGVSGVNAQVYRPADFGLVEHAGEQFGAALAPGDFNDDQFLDLAVGIPFDRPVLARSGAMLAVYGVSDSTRPTVGISPAAGQENPTSDGEILFSVTFSEAVLGFQPLDVIVGGTAGATTVSITGSGASFEVGVSGMTTSGVVTIDIPDAVVVDAAGNPNLAAPNENNDVSYVHPVTVSINQAADQEDPTSGDAIRFDVRFSEAVTGFTAEDVFLSGTALPTTASVEGSGADYLVTVSGMSRDGTVVATILEGIVEPFNRASSSVDNEVTYEQPRPPTVVINQATNQPDPTSGDVINFVAFFSEPVTGFTSEDVVLTGTGVATNVEVSGDGIRFAIAVSGFAREGTVIASIPANVAIDADGSPNLASTSDDNVVEYQQQPVTVTINQASSQADPTSGDTVLFQVRFSEPVSGFDEDDIDLGGTAGATTAVVTGSGANYQVMVSGMTQSGSVLADIPSGVVSPTNQASTSADNFVRYEAPSNPVGWTNQVNPLDVNNDGFVTPRDVLSIIIEINNRNVSDDEGRLPTIGTLPPNPPGYVDVNGDGFATPRDVLMVINYINDQIAMAAFLQDDDDA